MSDDTTRYQVEFEITLDDLVNFLRLDQRTLNAAGAIGGLAMVAIGVVFLVSAGDVLFGVLSIVIGVGWAALAQTRYFDRWRTARQAQAILGRTVELAIGPAGIDVTSNETLSTIEWATATGVKDDEQIVIVSRHRQPALWIPTRAFASDQQRGAVIDYMRGRIAAAREARAAAKATRKR